MGLTAIPACLYAVVDVLVLLALDASDDQARQVGVQVLLHLGLLYGRLSVGQQSIVTGATALDGAAWDLDIGRFG